MDLKDLTPKSNEIVVEIRHPVSFETLKNDDDTPMTITVYAPFAKEYKKAIHEQTTKRLKNAKNKGRVEMPEFEELEEISLETLAKATKSWNITYGGEKPKLTVGKAKEIYDEVFWIRNQVEEAIATSLDFMKV